MCVSAGPGSGSKGGCPACFFLSIAQAVWKPGGGSLDLPVCFASSWCLRDRACPFCTSSPTPSSCSPDETQLKEGCSQVSSLSLLPAGPPTSRPWANVSRPKSGALLRMSRTFLFVYDSDNHTTDLPSNSGCPPLFWVPLP